MAQDLVIGTCYNIDPAPKLEPTSTKWHAHRCWHKICRAAQNHWNTQGHTFSLTEHATAFGCHKYQTKYTHNKQKRLWQPVCPCVVCPAMDKQTIRRFMTKMVDSCRWSSACLCVLWSYNKQWSNRIIISYTSFIHTSPRHTDLRQLQGSRDKKQHEPSTVVFLKALEHNCANCRQPFAHDFLQVHHAATAAWAAWMTSIVQTWLQLVKCRACQTCQTIGKNLFKGSRKSIGCH